jgi:hypothetical protein
MSSQLSDCAILGSSHAAHHHNRDDRRPTWTAALARLWRSTTTTGMLLPEHRQHHAPSPRLRKSALPAKPRGRDSDLYDLVVDLNWHRVVRYCVAHPATATYQEGDTLETPLHAACQLRPPVRVVQALVEAHPAARYTAARNGDLVLQIACRDNASLAVLRALLADAPALARMETKWGDGPLRALWRSRQATLPQENYASPFWQKVRLLLQAVAASRRADYAAANRRPAAAAVNAQDDDDDENRHLLHAAVSLGSLGCPPAVLDFILHAHPDQVFEADHTGRLPLHLATAPARWSSGKPPRRYKPREQASISKLLERYPAAAGVAVDDRLPLHLALAHRHGWEGGVRPLVECAPHVLGDVDPARGLLPFLAAAVPVGDTRVDLTTIYQCLRTLPAALEATRGEEKEPADAEAPSAVRRHQGLYAAAAVVGAVGVGAALYQKRRRRFDCV